MLGTYVSLALILGASFVVGQAVFCACGHRERSPLAPAVGLGLLCAVAWLAADLGLVGLGWSRSRGRAHHRRRHTASLRAHNRLVRRRPARRRRRGRPGVAAVPDRDALRDPGDLAQPRHVAASICDRPDRERGRGAAHRRGLPAGPARSGRGAGETRDLLCARVWRADAGDGGRCDARPARSTQRPGARQAHRRRAPGWHGLPRRLVLHPRRLQGDDAGPVPARVRRRPRRAGRGRVRERLSVEAPQRRSPRGAGDRLALRLQLPRAYLARRDSRGVRGGRGRSRPEPRRDLERPGSRP